MTAPARAEGRTGRREAAGMRRAFLMSSAGHLIVLAACLLLGHAAGTASGPAAVDVVLVAAGVEGGAASAGPERRVSLGAPAPPGSAPKPLRTGYGLRAERPPPPERPGRKEVESTPRRQLPQAAPAEPVPPSLPAPEFSETAPFRPESFPEGSPAARTAPSGDGPSSTEEMPSGAAPAGAAEVSGGAAPAEAGRDEVRETSKDAGDLRGPMIAGNRGGGGDGAEGRLRDAIQARIVYPDEAVRRGLEGEVLLRIRIEKGGNPGEVRVARSSGVRILDEAARRGVVRAAPLPSVPGWFEVPVRFSLR